MFLPVYLALFLLRKPLLLLIFYPANAAAALYLFNLHFREGRRLKFQIDSLEERLNLLREEFSRGQKGNLYLKEKIARYNGLKKIVEEINESMDLDTVAGSISSVAFSLVAGNKGNCLLYLLDQDSQKLNLFKAKKEDRDLVIREKEGDIFDSWVLRHASALLIEDAANDFRFDLQKLKALELRPMGSLASVPLVNESKFHGILRLDNPKPFFYTQDDLRFLMKICELGALAIENSKLFKAVQSLATRDELTSLFTKGFFREQLREECLRAARHKAAIQLLMLDIDFFKNYNDKFGHSAGDLVLKKISTAIAEALKNTRALAARFGGEEFCVVLPAMDKERALAIAEKLRGRIAREKIILRRQETGVSVSIGVAGFPRDAASEDELIQKADRAMYEAKKNGRNRVCSL
ncbi:MAG: sensor domain-containing diguanylate cyclase [Candidatus Omnitrophota bacterium]|nr:sensor domain-containing diguanylate cyclase [Candidatus Omnitrophota bacterium]